MNELRHILPAFSEFLSLVLDLCPLAYCTAHPIVSSEDSSVFLLIDERPKYPQDDITSSPVMVVLRRQCALFSRRERTRYIDPVAIPASLSIWPRSMSLRHLLFLGQYPIVPRSGNCRLREDVALEMSVRPCWDNVWRGDPIAGEGAEPRIAHSSGGSIEQHIVGRNVVSA